MIKKILIILLSIFILWFLTHTAIIILDGINDKTAVSDAAVVLGNMVNKDGLPSKRLKSRLDKAVSLYNEKYFKTIIVSGGIDKNGNNEADIMKTYLTDKGIPSSSVITDPDGNNTYMTAKNTVEIMKKNNYQSVFIISQFYHISRTKLAFSKMNIKNISSAHADYYELRDIYSLFREFFAFYGYLIMH